MSIRRAKSPDALYADVADYDLVLVPDNALASAINRRVETPTFGTFATTPRRLAAGRRETAEDRLAFLELVDRTDHTEADHTEDDHTEAGHTEADHSWKALSYAVGNVLQCWEHEGSREAIRDYPPYVDETTEAVVDALADVETTSGHLSEHTIPTDTSVAVLGHDQLTPLERSVVPDHADRISLFTDDAFDLPAFHVFSSSAAVVDALVETVDADSAERVAVVLDGGSRYASLVEAALDAAGVPHYGGPGFVDDPDHRAVLRLLRLAHRGSDATVADAKPICARAGIDAPIDHDRKRLDRADVPALAWIVDVCDRIAGDDAFTFENACTDYEVQTGADLGALRAELDELGLRSEPTTRERVEDLSYYLQRYDVPVDRDREGVLLADATSSGYVDRPVVFSIGLDEGWTHPAPQRPWIDADAQYERHLRGFQLLLQSGAEQYYLVRDAAGGRPVTPCPYLQELLEERVDRFSDLDSVAYTRPGRRAGDRGSDRGSGGGDGRATPHGFERDPENASLEVESTPLTTISQSSLNSYVNSPLDYCFSRLLDSPDREYFREGNLFHDFAEVAVAHPDLIDDDAIEETVELMLAEAGPFFPDTEEPLRRRKYRVGLETIVEYLDANPPETEDVLTPASGWGTNAVADHFGVEIDSPLTERWFENHDVGAKGKIDLVRAPDHLVDYKSGHKKSATRVVRAANVDPPHDTPNFQAALYLAHFRTEHPDTEIEFTFLHFLETLDDAIAGDDPAASLADATTTVTYYPETFEDFVASRAAFEELLDGYADCVATFEDLGYPAYREIVADLSFPETTDREELRASAFASDFTAQVAAATADDVDAEKGADQAIRALNGVRTRSFFEDDLDAFEEFLADSIETINGYRAGEGRFPVDGPGGEPNYRRVDHRDLLLEGER